MDHREPLPGHQQLSLSLGVHVLLQLPLGHIPGVVAMAIVDSHISISHNRRQQEGKATLVLFYIGTIGYFYNFGYIFV